MLYRIYLLGFSRSSSKIVALRGGSMMPLSSHQDERSGIKVIHAVSVSWQGHVGSARMAGLSYQPTGTEYVSSVFALAPVASLRSVIDATKLGFWLRAKKNRPLGA